MADDQRFCPKCGTPVDAAAPTSGAGAASLNNVVKNVTAAATAGDTNLLLVGGAALLHLLMLILWFCGTIMISYWGEGQGVNVPLVLDGFFGVLVSILTVLCLLASIGVLVCKYILKLPFLQNKLYDIIPLATAGWCFLWQIIGFIVAFIQIADAIGFGVGVHFSFGGWIFILCAMGAIAIGIIMLIKSLRKR